MRATSSTSCSSARSPRARRYHVRLAGARAAARLHALAAGDQHQTHDAYALTEHAAPQTLSEQVFRGIAAGRARVAFNGKVTVRARRRRRGLAPVAARAPRRS